MESKITELDTAYEILNDLSKLLDERIVDLHEVKGGMQARHAYIFYRKHVWDAMDALRKQSKLK